MNKEEAKKQIDADEASINGVKLITACRAKDIIDAIDDHPKVKLPREVGEELEDWLKTDSVDTIITDLVCVSEGDPQAVRDWWDSTLDATYLIADMARYGWEAEKETLYNVKVPHTKHLWYYKSLNEDLRTISVKELCSEFTEAEIEQYGLQDCEKEEVKK